MKTSKSVVYEEDFAKARQAIQKSDSVSLLNPSKLNMFFEEAKSKTLDPLTELQSSYDHRVNQKVGS